MWNWEKKEKENKQPNLKLLLFFEDGVNDQPITSFFNKNPSFRSALRPTVNLISNTGKDK